MVSVDARLVLEKLSIELTRVGEWVNVVGYVTAKPTPSKDACSDVPSAHVQALLLWPAGPLDVQRYEKYFEEHR